MNYISTTKKAGGMCKRLKAGKKKSDYTGLGMSTLKP